MILYRFDKFVIKLWTYLPPILSVLAVVQSNKSFLLLKLRISSSEFLSRNLQSQLYLIKKLRTQDTLFWPGKKSSGVLSFTPINTSISPLVTHRWPPVPFPPLALLHMLNPYSGLVVWRRLRYLCSLFSLVCSSSKLGINVTSKSSKLDLSK